MPIGHWLIELAANLEKTNTGHKIALHPQNTLLKGEIRAIRVITQIDQLTTRWPARVHFKKSGGKFGQDC